MNKVILMGRLVRDPEVKIGNMAVGRYTLAVDRRFKRDGQPEADFINCVCFGKSAEFAEKYLHKGTKIAITGRIQTGSYTNKEGAKVYTTDVVVEEQEFAESKASSQGSDTVTSAPASNNASANDFMKIPDGAEENLPFL